MYSFNSCHKFSVRFIFRGSGGVFHQLMDRAAKKSLAFLDVCLGSLSCMKVTRPIVRPAKRSTSPSDTGNTSVISIAS